MISRPQDVNAFEFVRIASLRAAQLMAGCRATIPEGRTPIITAQLEVATGNVDAVPRADISPADAARALPLDPVPQVRR